MQALKALVIFMGVLIVAGTTVVFVTIYQRLTADSGEGEAAAGAEPGVLAPAHLPAFGAKNIALPPGSEVEDMAAADGRLVLRLRLGDGGRRILVLDLGDGAVLGTIDLEPAQ